MQQQQQLLANLWQVYVAPLPLEDKSGQLHKLQQQQQQQQWSLAAEPWQNGLRFNMANLTAISWFRTLA